MRVDHRLARLERPLPDREHDEGQVELSALDELEQVPVVRSLGELDGDVRPRVGELAQEEREDAGAHALERPDAKRSGRALGEGGEVCLGGLKPRHDPRGMAEEQLARFREGDAARASGPFHESLADDPLERLDLLADGGLGVSEPLGRAPERSLLGDRLEGREMPQFDAQPSISSHDRNES